MPPTRARHKLVPVRGRVGMRQCARCGAVQTTIKRGVTFDRMANWHFWTRSLAAADQLKRYEFVQEYWNGRPRLMRKAPICR